MKKTRIFQTISSIVATSLLFACGNPRPTSTDFKEFYNSEPILKYTKIVEADLKVKKSGIDEYDFKSEGKLELLDDRLINAGNLSLDSNVNSIKRKALKDLEKYGAAENFSIEKISSEVEDYLANNHQSKYKYIPDFKYKPPNVVRKLNSRGDEVNYYARGTAEKRGGNWIFKISIEAELAPASWASNLYNTVNIDSDKYQDIKNEFKEYSNLYKNRITLKVDNAIANAKQEYKEFLEKIKPGSLYNGSYQHAAYTREGDILFKINMLDGKKIKAEFRNPNKLRSRVRSASGRIVYLKGGGIGFQLSLDPASKYQIGSKSLYHMHSDDILF